jgi:hypothetical protein
MRECTNKRFVIVKRIIKSIIIYLHILTLTYRSYSSALICVSYTTEPVVCERYS